MVTVLSTLQNAIANSNIIFFRIAEKSAGESDMVRQSKPDNSIWSQSSSVFQVITPGFEAGLQSVLSRGEDSGKDSDVLTLPLLLNQTAFDKLLQNVTPVLGSSPR